MKHLFCALLLMVGMFACGPQDSTPINPLVAYQQIAPTTEPFTANLSTSRDTTVVTPHGIIVKVPAEAFLDVSGNPVIGEIELALTEAFTTAEMVYQPVSTITTSGELLASKGMIKVEATQLGSPLSLKPDKTVDLEFPGAGNSYVDYQLFYGVEISEGEVEWEVDTLPVEMQLNTFDTYVPGPIQTFLYDDHEDVSKIFFRYEAFYDELNDYTKFTDKEMRRYRALGIEVRFRLFEDGSFGPHTVLGEINENEKQKLIRRFEQLPSISTVGRTGDVQGYFTFIIETEAEKRQRELEESLSNKFYLSINRLGWTNCDIFLRLELPVTNMSMVRPTGFTVIKLVFSDYKTTVSPTYSAQDSLIFYDIPMGAEVSIVSITPHSDGVSMSITPTITSRVLKELLPAEIMSKEEMVQRLNALN